MSIHDDHNFCSLVLFKMTTLFSGATVGVTKNTVAAQIVSTMPVEELKVNLRQKSSVIIYLKIYLLKSHQKVLLLENLS